MADSKAKLRSLGWTEEDITAHLANEKVLKAIEALTAEAENGETTRLQYDKMKADLDKYNKEQVIPYVLKKDQEVASVKADLAKKNAYLQSMKDAGYEVSDAVLEANSSPNPIAPTTTNANYVSKEDFDKSGTDWVMSNLELAELAEVHRDLTGKGLRVKSEYDEFKTKGRPGENLRTYVARKYDHDRLSTEKETKDKSEYEERLRAEGRAAEKADYEAKFGANPETRVPVASKYDSFKADPERKDSWRTQQGRDASRQALFQKYAGAKF